MASETKPIPAVAMTASAYAQAEWQRTLNALGVQTLEAMGLPTDGTWLADFGTGLATRKEQPGPALVEDTAG